MRLAGCSIAHRPPKTPGTALAPREALPTDLERLLRAYGRLDGAGRAEVLHHAEQLAGAAP